MEFPLVCCVEHLLVKISLPAIALAAICKQEYHAALWRQSRM
jgi:hypothetical protein